MHNYERVLVLEGMWKEGSPRDFVVILGAFYSCSQKHNKYICYLHLDIIIDKNKDRKKKKKEQMKGLSYFMTHASKRQSNSYNVS